MGSQKPARVLITALDEYAAMTPGQGCCAEHLRGLPAEGHYCRQYFPEVISLRLVKKI